MAELFAAGRMAREKGWTSVGIVDSHTYRMLCGQYLPGECPMVASMVVLQTVENAEIEAARPPLRIALHILRSDKAITTTPSIKRSACRSIYDGYTPGDLYSRYSLTLHDWNLPLFQNHSVRSRAYANTVDRVLSLKPSLPAEIVNAIRADLEAPEPLDSLTGAPVLLKNDKNTLEFHALVPFADMAASTAALNDMVRQANPDMTAVIYP